MSTSERCSCAKSRSTASAGQARAITQLFSYRGISIQKRGQVPNHEASVNKMYRSEVSQRVARLGTQLLGMYGVLDRGGKWAPLRGRIAHLNTPVDVP